MQKRNKIGHLFGCLVLLLSLQVTLVGASTEPSEDQLKVSNKIYNLTRSMLSDDPVLIGAIQEVGEGLIAVSGSEELKNRDFDFWVIHHATPRAFSVAPRDIYITTGLLDQLADEAELAVVIAREFSYLQDNNRAASVVGSKKSTANLLLWGGTIAGTAYVVKSALDSARETPYGSTPSAGPGVAIAMGVALLPSSIYQMVHKSRVNRARLDTRFRQGRDLSSQLTEGGAFDALALELLAFGAPSEKELQADRDAHTLVQEAGYRSDALLTYLQTVAAFSTVEATRLKEARPGLERRITLVEKELHGYTGGEE